MNQKLKVNIHICEHCNYNCRHCFAKFGCEKMLCDKDWFAIIDNIVSSGEVGEINIAGGEPLLHPQLTGIADYIHTYGIPVSLVTNGSLITEKWIGQNGRKFRTVGFSIDSLNPGYQRCIGRCTSDKNTISSKDFEEKIISLREVNPDVKIKVNTVVSGINWRDSIAEDIRRWNVDRWKILKMQVFDNNVHCNANIAPSDDEYDSYVENALFCFGMEPDNQCVLYKSVKTKTEIVAERILKGSYIMIDTNGFLLDNTKGSDYIKVCDCRTESFSENLKKLTFYEDLYASRY